jgi:hypothetical protein
MTHDYFFLEKISFYRGNDRLISFWRTSHIGRVLDSDNVEANFMQNRYFSFDLENFSKF